MCTMIKNNWRIRRIAIICSNFPPLTTRTIPFFIFPIYNFLFYLLSSMKYANLAR